QSKAPRPANASMRNGGRGSFLAARIAVPQSLVPSAQLEHVEPLHVRLDADLPHQLRSARHVGLREIAVQRLPVAPDGEEPRAARDHPLLSGLPGGEEVVPLRGGAVLRTRGDRAELRVADHAGAVAAERKYERRTRVPAVARHVADGRDEAGDVSDDVLQQE